MKYMKVENDALLTPIIEYQKGDLKVTNIGMIHIGMASYYAVIQSELDQIPFGFFEQVKPLVDINNVPVDKRQYVEGMQNLNHSYETFANYLGFVTQRGEEGLTYADHWENPDMALDEFLTRASHKTLRMVSDMGTNSGGLDRYHQKHPEALATVMKGGMKFVSVFPFLNEVTMALSGDSVSGSVILEGRNQKLFDAMGPEFENPRSDHIGAIYGAAHLDGMDLYLKSKGFACEGIKWVRAWDLRSKMSFFEAVAKLMC